MIRILIAGAGQIGVTMAHLLSQTGLFEVTLADQALEHVPAFLKQTPTINLLSINVTDQAELTQWIRKQNIAGVVSCLPYFLNKTIADIAKETKIHYFDLTEDVEVSTYIHGLAKDAENAFVTQCGLAPGFVNIIAHHLMQKFDTLETIKLRCGGLPKTSSNELQYAFTWSIDGLINEYHRLCPAIENGERTLLTPLTHLETIQVDGLCYEAFNTSGGIGSLTDTYAGKVRTLNYKTIRYPGHCSRMRFLMQDLKLGEQPELLKQILKEAIPSTTEDVVIVYISVCGKIKNKFVDHNFVNKYYGIKKDGIAYSALQLITAASASTVIAKVMQGHYQGHVRQEQFSLDDILQGPFKQYFPESL